MTSESLLKEISDYCRDVGMAESTFGRLAVNDGKLVSRLRFGGKVTTDTVQRVRDFIGRSEAALGEAALPAANRGLSLAHEPLQGSLPGRRAA